MPRNLLAIVLTLASFTTASHGAVVFVNASQVLPPASQDGTTWATAFKSLADALAATPAGSEYWVATGTYVPTTGTNRFFQFNVGNGRKLFGGFLPGAASPNDRDPSAHPTILSGDIGVPGDPADNSARVVLMTGGSGCVLDGFIVEGGNGNVSPSFHIGGGLQIGVTSDFLVRNCIFRNNFAALRGGGVSVFGLTSGTIQGCVFENNVSGIGGGLDKQGDPGVVSQCRFVGNHATNEGGGVFVLASSGVIMTSCEFSGNSASFSGGAIALSSPNSAISGCTFSNNTADTRGGAIEVVPSAAGSTVNNSLFHANVAPTGQHINNMPGIPVIHNGFSANAVGGVGNVVVNPQFRDVDGADGIVGTIDDDLRLDLSSDAIDRGCGTLLPADGADLDGDGDTSEKAPFDCNGNARLVDELTANLGLDALPFVDFGAHEFERPYRIYCVNDDVVGGAGDGSSWENAFDRLDSAILIASSVFQTKPVEIWVAQGTYVPGEDREQSFSFQGNLKLYGGFKGSEAVRAARDPIAFPSILSGEIGNAGNQDNSYHVVRFSGDNVYAETVLDGFVITGGNAEGRGNDRIGGGMLIEFSAQPAVRTCRFLGNDAKLGGGAIGVTGGSSKVTLFNSHLAGNDAPLGGAIHITDAAGGSTIVNCTIAGNHAESAGGAHVNGVGSSAEFLNTLFALNTDDGSFGDKEHYTVDNGGSISLSHCAAPCAGLTFPGTNLIALPAKLKEPEGDDGEFGTLDDRLDIASGSPCIDAGAAAGPNAHVPFDIHDIDEDGDTSELYPLDGNGSARAFDDLAMPNTDPDLPIDIGADERDSQTLTPPVLGDLNDDGLVNGSDLAILLGGWGGSDQAIDLTGDCTVGGADLAVLLGSWTS